MAWHEFGSRRVYDSPWVSVDLVDVGLPDGTRIDHHADIRGLVRDHELTDGLSLTALLAYLALPG